MHGWIWIIRRWLAVEGCARDRCVGRPMVHRQRSFSRHHDVFRSKCVRSRHLFFKPAVDQSSHEETDRVLKTSEICTAISVSIWRWPPCGRC